MFEGGNGPIKHSFLSILSFSHLNIHNDKHTETLTTAKVPISNQSPVITFKIYYL